jgi:hypothetical protein
MQTVLSSNRDGLLPQDIAGTLCQGHACGLVVLAMSNEELAPW